MNAPHQLVHAFFIALGVVLGGSTVGALGTLITGGMPMTTMGILAERLKLWAMVAALGGTFATLKTLESGLLGGQMTTVARQIAFLLSAFLGAHTGYLILATLVRG